MAYQLHSRGKHPQREKQAEIIPHSFDLVLGIPYHHSCHILLVKTVDKARPASRERDIDCLLLGEWQSSRKAQGKGCCGHLGIYNLPQPYW